MLMSREKKHVGVGAEEAVTLVVGTEAAAAVILGDGKWYKTHHDVIIDLVCLRLHDASMESPTSHT